MNDPRFRLHLAARILGILGAATLLVEHTSCTSSNPGTTAGTGGASGVGGAGSHSSSATASTGSSSSATGTGGAKGTGGDAGTGDAAGTGGDAGIGSDAGTGGAGGAGGGIPSSKDCFTWPVVDTDDGGVADAGPVDAGGCPVDPTAALAVFVAEGCPRGFEPSIVLAGPLSGSPAGECCYTVDLTVCGPGGRPYRVDDRAQLAALERGAGTNGWSVGPGSSVDHLSPGDRACLADAWGTAALFEHASVASFARFSLELLAAGAPSDLVALAQQAALDEIEHARLCFALASAYAGEPLSPGRFPVGSELRVGAGLADLAASTIVEGCIGETVAAVLAAEQLARAEDPVVRAALARITADEARHAELAWRTVAWAQSTGDGEVRAAVARALEAALAGVADSSSAPVDAPERALPRPPAVASRLAAHGLLDDATRAQLVAGAMRDVVAPAARVLLQPRASGADRARVPAA